jgi:hypothetical protein
MRRLILAGTVLAALAASPAAASAAGTVSGGPVRAAGGQSVTLHAVDARKDTLTIALDRGTAANGETEVLMFTTGVRVTVGRGSAAIKGTLGRRGSVDLRLRNVRSERGAKLPEGCTGSKGITHSGRLEGKLRLRLANGKTVTIRSFPASTYVGGNLRCDRDRTPTGDGGDGSDADGKDDEPRLVLNTQTDGASVTFMATKRTLQLSRVEPARKDGRATVQAISSVRASGSNLLVVSDGGARAGVNPAGAFTGNGVFTSTTGGGPFASGPLTGSLKVKPQSAPVIAIAGENAMLMNAG